MAMAALGLVAGADGATQVGHWGTLAQSAALPGGALGNLCPFSSAGEPSGAEAPREDVQVALPSCTWRGSPLLHLARLSPPALCADALQAPSCRRARGWRLPLPPAHQP